VVNGNIMVGVAFDGGGDVGEVVDQATAVVTASGWSGIGVSRGAVGDPEARYSSRRRRFTPISQPGSDLAAMPAVRAARTPERVDLQ
jgi:hypothetical protein